MKIWRETQMKKMEEARMKAKRTRVMAALTYTARMTTAAQVIMRAILVTAITTWKAHNRKQRDVIK